MFDRDEILHLLGLIESTLSTIEERCKEDVPVLHATINRIIKDLN